MRGAAEAKEAGVQAGSVFEASSLGPLAEETRNSYRTEAGAPKDEKSQIQSRGEGPPKPYRSDERALPLSTF